MTRVIIEQVQTGGDRNFGYLIGDGEAKQALLVDPSYRPELLVERAKAQGLEVVWIINTHSHGDHTNGNEAAKELTGAAVAAFQGSLIQPDISLEDNQKLSLGRLSLRVVHTPGHCDDHIVLFLEQWQAAFTGDHLFVGKIGGTSTREDARTQYESLQRLYRDFPEETMVWPGHDVGCRPCSTLMLEKVSNPFLMVKNFEEFVKLKGEWSTYKTQHGLL